MALSEATVNKHNIKRAEVFAANGLCDLDIAFAHPEFVGYATSDVDCCLCDHKHIKWLFAVRFDAPDITTALGKISTGIVRTEAVTLKPVGSKCITDWLDAIPESAAKLAALKIWAKELKKANKAKTRKAMENKLKALGYADQTALSVACFDAYDALKKAKKGTWYLKNKLRKYGKQAKYGSHKSASTVKAAADFIIEAYKLLETVPVAPVAPTASVDPLAHLTDDARKAVLKGRSVWKKDILSDSHAKAFISIGKFLVAKGDFASKAQRDFYADLVGMLEDAQAPVAAPVAPAPVVVTKPAVPGTAEFVSASGVVGARY